MLHAVLTALVAAIVALGSFSPAVFGMGITNAMRDLLANAAVGTAYTAFNNANAYIGVGDSTTAFAAAQTDLQAATNKLRVAMDATYPQQATNVLTFRSTFSTAQANYAWQEWGVFNASSAGTMFNRKVESLGTKTSAQSWQITVTLTLTAA